ARRGRRWAVPGCGRGRWWGGACSPPTERSTSGIACRSRARSAVTSMVHALGLDETDAGEVLTWYDAIVAAVTDITAGRGPAVSGAEAFSRLRAAVERSLGRDQSSSLVAAAAGAAGGLSGDEVVSNAAVLLFGGIETTEGMIANAA